MSQYGQPVITQAYYLNPWAPLPPGWGKNGIDVLVNKPVGGINLVLAGRLRQDAVTLIVVVGLVPTEILIAPTAPLSTLLAYAVDVQWVTQGTDPNSITWNDPSAIATTPILTDNAQLVSAVIAPGTLSFALNYSTTSLAPVGANVTVFDQNGISAGFVRVHGNTGSLAFTPVNTSTYTLYVQPVIPVAGTPLGAFQPPFTMGPIGPGVTLPALAPVIGLIDYDKTTLRVSWGMPTAWTGAAPTSGVLQVLAGTVVIAEAVVSANVGSLDIPLNAAQSNISVRVRATFGNLVGPFSTAVSPWLAGVHPITTATDPISAKATLAWPATTGATGYVLSFSDGRPNATTTTASYPLSAALAANTALQVAVRATFTTSTLTTNGPFGPWTAIPASLPTVIGADYNGSQISATWSPVGDASGYIISVIAAGATTITAQHTVTGTATHAVFPVSLSDLSKTYSVTVQAIDNNGAGLAAAGLPIYQPAFGISNTAPSVAPPYVFPAATIARTAQSIILYLPNLALPGQTIAAITQGAFMLAPNTDSATKAALPYTLTLEATSEAWVFSSGSQPLPSIRPTLQTHYIAFLKAAETAKASPWGIWMLQQAIARFMPQTFAETLYYAYGLNLGAGPGTGTIDLRSGMILRVDFANYAYVWTSVQNNWLNGFVGSNRTDFEVGDFYNHDGNWTQGVDAFIAQLVSAGVMSVPAPPYTPSTPQQAGVADAGDLFYSSFPKPFYRLFFPANLLDPSGVGSTTTSSNFTLVSAATYTDLTTATTTPSLTSLVAFFRGRAVVTACIRITVNGNDVVVPIGTTLGNVLDRYAARPPATALQVNGLVWERALGSALVVYGSGAPAANAIDLASRYRIRLDWNTLPVYASPIDATTLPLLHGDRLSFTAP
ncbi:hypothetical protein [Dyella tabacisoli]|uniref:Fibronectin type-III domain-containing protein n=1 Tax=Dyella tabacisoli TaxID=2282381 RepID=A0A369URS0_9GAMM|nr:hypothetical protein [Dyella tabacisoli]RDD83003.1 hypothetical protein DVJ77_03910 [Dyella tabacisoli]